MQLKQIKSSAIASHGYDPATRVLAVVFNSGKRYDHQDVPPEVAAGLEGAESAGRFYGTNIAGKFHAETVDTDAAAGGVK